MNTTIRAHNLRARVAITLLAVLIVLTVALVFALQPAPTTSDRDPAMSAGGKGGSSLTEDSDLERHAEVVERLGNGSLR
jgi:uncharacterized membrane protein